MRVESISFPNHNSALLARASLDVSARHVTEALELPAPRALLILNGATAELDQKVCRSLDELFKAVARLVIDEQITVLTGGTNAGVFALFGSALEKAGKLSAPCVGISAGLHVKPADLEPHHSHFVLVETEEWSAATPVMYRMAAALESDCHSLSLFAGGGPNTIGEMQHNLAQQREMIMLAGSLGATDDVIAAHLGEPTTEEDIRRIAREGCLTIFALEDKPDALANLIYSRLFSV